MANLEINVPDDLHERLRRVAGVNAGDAAVSEFALAVIRREVERLESRIHQEKHGKRRRCGTAGVDHVGVAGAAQRSPDAPHRL